MGSHKTMKNTNQLVEAASLSVVLPPSVAHFEQRGTLSGNLLSERENLLGPNVVPSRKDTFAALEPALGKPYVD